MYLTLIIFILAVLIYLYGRRNFDYWKRRGVKYEEPLVFFGGNLKGFFENVGIAERFANLYKRYPNEKYVGFFEGNRQALLLRDVEIIKRVLVADFQHFHYRAINLDKTSVEPLFHNLFTSDGDVWKLMRQKLTPLFSSGKLKAMFPVIVENAEKLLIVADAYARAGAVVDVRELMARYSTDFIGSYGFGIDSDSLTDANSNFRKLGKRIVTPTLRDKFIALLKRTAPEMFKQLTLFAPEIDVNMTMIVKEILKQRNYKPSGRNDFIDLMLELKQKGNIVGESVEKRNSDGSPAIIELELTDLLLTAQVFIFFVAGFETSSSTSSVALHMLAFHPEAQQRCHEEIDAVLSRYDGKMCYDAIKEMKYLEMVLKEGMRLLPPMGFLLRKSVREYTFEGTGLTIDADTVIFVSTQAIQSDEQYFENAEEFIPERFHPDNLHKINKNVFLPFGDGPRSCVGERMGIMQSMAGIATVLREFEVAPAPSSVRKPKIDPMSLIVTVIAGGLPLMLKRRIK